MMSRSQKQLVVLAMLLAIMGAVYARAFRSPAPSLHRAQPQQLLAEAPVREASSIALTAPPSAQRTAQRQRVAQLAWARDPFFRGAASPQTSELALSGILWDAAQPIAIINGQMVRVGEELEGYRVVEISHDVVSVTDGTQTFQLQLSP